MFYVYRFHYKYMYNDKNHTDLTPNGKGKLLKMYSVNITINTSPCSALRYDYDLSSISNP